MKVLQLLNYNIFSTDQIVIIVILAVVLAALLGLNGWLIYLLHKRGERKMYSQQLKRQREALIDKLNAMYMGEEVDVDGKTSFKIVADTDEEPEEETTVADEADEDEEDEEGESLELVVTETGSVVRYNRSFTARLIQADNDLKARYSEIKNHIMSYKGIRSRMSWNKETFHIGRRSIASFVIRGKTLCLCLATDAKMFDGTKYKVEDLSARSKNNSMPCKFRITSDRRTGYAKELTDIVMAGFGVEKQITYFAQDYTLPFKSTEVLLKRRLIKIVGNGIRDLEKEDALAAARRIRYNRSFEARIIQADDELKGYYSKIKNHILSYDDIRSADSWKKESFLKKRTVYATFVIRGKTLCLCLALDPKQFENTKYKVEDLSARVSKTKTPLMYRVKSARRINYALQLIDKMFAEAGVEKIERIPVNYAVPFVSTENLIKRGLIKEVALQPKSEETEKAAATTAANETATA
ncbi:MAG: hypothetical protein NC350_03830 [Corallococcus sp.]|nr:hypothetical protein [Corallococcus sp.]